MKLPPYPVGAAFWMYTPAGIPYAELDVAEFAPANGRAVIDFAYHKAQGSAWASPFIIKLDLAESWYQRWHTYTLHWTPSSLTFQVDNRLLYAWWWSAPRAPMHPIIHMEVDGNNRPNQVPAYLEIDYVRVWE